MLKKGEKRLPTRAAQNVARVCCGLQSRDREGVTPPRRATARGSIYQRVDIPARSVALFLVDIAQERKRPAPLNIGTSRYDGVDQGHRCYIGNAERWCLYRHDERHVSQPDDGRQQRIRDSDTIGAFGLGPFESLDGHAQTSTEADRNRDVRFPGGPRQMKNAAGAGVGRNGQLKQRQARSAEYTSE